MPRSYWRIVLAVVGFLALTGEHPNPKAQAEQAQAQQSIANSLSNIAATDHDLTERAERPPERDPCGPYHYGSNADLCAQWKAADASADSAWWAAFAGWFGGLSFIGVLAAIGVALHSNWIARDTAKRQLRAYITIPRAEIFYHDKYPDKIVLAAHFKNDGETPAQDVRARLFCSIFPGIKSDFHPSMAHTDTRDQSQLIIGKGEERNIQFFQESRHWGGQPQEIIEGDFSIYAYGYVIYKDIFGDEHTTRYCYFISPKTRDESTPTKHGQPAPIAARHGNEMS